MTRSMVADLVDAALELPVAPSFTRVGYTVRRHLEHWPPVGPVEGAPVVVVTGASSGLGRAAARQLVHAGASVVAVGRDERRLDELADELGDRLVVEVVDLADLEQTAALADRLSAQYDELAAIVHNAGALLADRRESPQGLELTVAVQVVSPFLLTHRLLDRLASPGRVLTMSSGGMYSAPVEIEHLQLSVDDYDGTRQYALAKRAQVTLNEMWAERTAPGRVVFHAAHPGWADTPGVADALPTFRRIVGPALRTPDQGADTVVWLALDDAGLESTGGFWLDRRRRPIHRLGSTRRSDTPEAREQLWEWVASAAGVPR